MDPENTSPDAPFDEHIMEVFHHLPYVRILRYAARKARSSGPVSPSREHHERVAQAFDFFAGIIESMCENAK